MNDKLKQSLEGRLNGMRWGEREQAEVFRQIQRKELQDVKHVKRGTGMLAIAMAVLFLVMGAAFALDQLPQPEDTTLLTQPTEAEFISVPSARLENDYLTTTVHNTLWDGEDVSFDVTLQLKEPEKYALIIGNYTNPGSTSRERLRITLRGECEIDLQNNNYPSFLIIDDPEVIDMTPDSATVRLVGNDVWLSADVAELNLTVAGSTNDPLFTDEIAFAIPREKTNDAEAAARRFWLFENELVTGYSAGTRIEGETFTLLVDVVPKKPWYVINTSAPDKSTLYLNTEWSIGYDGMPVLNQMSPTKLEYTQIADGVRISASFPFPVEHHSLRLLGHVYTRDAVIRSQTHCLINMTSTRPTSADLASLTPVPTAAPEPATTPMSKPERSEPAGELIGGSELVSVFLEESWFDGFSAEARLRIRADDASICRLSTTPNENLVPSDMTWVVQLDVPDNDYSWQNYTQYTLTGDEYGDVILHLTYCDPHTSGHNAPNAVDSVDEFRLDLPLRITNERTWEKQDVSLTLRVARTVELEPHPLYCLESTEADLFLQGAVVTTGRYHYIGLMLADSRAHIVRGHLLDESGEALASGNYIGTNGKSLTLFPRVLFPYDGDPDAGFHLVVIRVDGTIELPEPLPIRIEKYTAKNGYELLADLLLSTTPAQEEAAADASSAQ